jgi:hypothetical protein
MNPEASFNRVIITIFPVHGVIRFVCNRAPASRKCWRSGWRIVPRSIRTEEKKVEFALSFRE